MPSRDTTVGIFGKAEIDSWSHPGGKRDPGVDGNPPHGNGPNEDYEEHSSHDFKNTVETTLKTARSLALESTMLHDRVVMLDGPV